MENEKTKYNSVLPTGLKTEAGFSLVELLVAMVIILIIVLAFTPLLTHSIMRIYDSGYRSQAIATAQGDVEGKLLSKEYVDSLLLTFDIDNREIEVRGGLIETETEVNDMGSELTALVPLVPTIEVDPPRLIEGYEEIDLTIRGFDVDFSGVLTLNSFIDDDGNTPSAVLGPSIFDIDEAETEAKIKLKEGLTNANSPYIMEVTAGDDVVKARLQIDLPNLLTGGDSGNIAVSPDAIQWVESGPNNIISGSINSMLWYNAQFIAVGDGGKIMSLKNRESWSNIDSPTNDHLYHLSRVSNQLISVGANGTILTSPNGRVWTERDSTTEKDLYAVASNNDQLIAAVGADGTVIQSSDGIDWGLLPGAGDEGVPAGNLNDIILLEDSEGDEYFMTIGDDGACFFAILSEGILVWTLVGLGTSENLNSVVAGFDKIVVVGDNGTILTSSDGESWSSETSGVSDHLNEVIRFKKETTDGDVEIFAAVGSNGTVIVFENGEWNKQTTPSSLPHLNSIVSRY